MAGALLLLAPGQLISWGTLYYAIAFLAAPIGIDTGWRQQDIFLAYSAGLLLTAIAATPVGRLLSRHGGRAVLRAGSLVATLALVVIALSPNMMAFTAGWLLAGLAMALTQYEAAFASLQMLVPHDFRQALGWLTIVGGFASTVFWPLTHWLADTVGWRQTLLLFAALHLVPCLLLHAALPSVKDRTLPKQCNTPSQRKRRTHGVPILLALAFAAIAAVTATISTQAGSILEAMHVSQGFALSILALVGPMQVVGRLLDLRLGREISPSKAGLIAMITLIAGLIVLVCAEYQPWALLGFSIAYGMANGILTLVRGSAPAELMPQHDYAVSLGIISGPALFIRAAAPAAAAWLIALWGAHIIPIVLIVIAVLGYATLNAAIIAARDRH